MKSTIRVDFKGVDAPGQAGFEPCIRVNLYDSEDVRDGLLKSFFQNLGGESNWLAVNFQNDTIDGIRQPERITLTPILPNELQETVDIINRRLNILTPYFSQITICGDRYEIIKSATETFTVGKIESNNSVTKSPFLNLFLKQSKEGVMEFKCNKIGDEYFIFKRIED